MSGDCPEMYHPRDFQGETGPGSGQPDLTMQVPVHCRGTGLGEL